MSQVDGNSTGGDSASVRNPESGTGFTVATRQRRMGTVTQPQGLIRPDTPPPTRSLLLDFAIPEQESNDQQPLTKSPPGYSSSVSILLVLFSALKWQGRGFLCFFSFLFFSSFFVCETNKTIFTSIFIKLD